ncbi:MAG: PIG-L family deacetylase [Parvibaculum sp.]|uniref:PIG-L family deacetylase n=1 Tax=Parvibaculum sp. TaxID=2024848 RepID=UPI002AB8A8C4|nr:PIG-L family deacetylase [Parvibaculum sp.]MDZ4381225.1 PIG-L family deacetylase [Parvibaculum sp.]
MRGIMVWGLGLAGAVLVLALAGGFIWVNRLFEAPEARQVASLAAEAGAERLMTVFAHPDDEQLANGLITSARAGGVFVAQVTATRGEAGTQVPVVARQRDLGIVRHAEVLKNGFALGIDEQEVWDYPDGGLPEVPMEELVSRVAEAMARYRPDLVVTFWPASGATGHKDHMRIGLAAEQAILRLRESGADYRGPSHIAYALTPARAMARLGGERGSFVAANQPAPSHSLPGNVASKLKGWEIHASQGDYVRKAYGVPARLLYLVWDKEFYALRNAADIGKGE